jgi:hypothetical protein
MMQHAGDSLTVATAQRYCFFEHLTQSAATRTLAEIGPSLKSAEGVANASATAETSNSLISFVGVACYSDNDSAGHDK